MKILNISYSDIFGGAAKSSYRIHKAINSIGKDFKSNMLVIKKETNDKDVFTTDNKLLEFNFKIKNYFGIILNKIDNNLNPKSYNLFSSPLLKIINKSDFDIINLHWINAETISIDNILKLKKPYVITMHDMWWICGTENYLSVDDFSWKNGKFKNFLSKIIYNKKKKLKPLAIICPSRWLTEMSKKSFLFKNSRVEHIPYPINHKIFYPKKISKLKKYNLEKNDKIKIFFSVFGNSDDKRKGLDLLIRSLNKIDSKKFELLIASKKNLKEKVNFKIKYLNYIHSEKELSKIYNLSDIVVLSSRLDNLPNVALEAQSCGKPIVAYDVGGMSDIITDGKNGYLIRPFKTSVYALKLNKLINNKQIRTKFSMNALITAKKKWSKEKIKSKYKNFFLSLN